MRVTLKVNANGQQFEIETELEDILPLRLFPRWPTGDGSRVLATETRNWPVPYIYFNEIKEIVVHNEN